MLLQVVTTTWVSFPRCQSCWCLVEKHKVSNGIPAVMHSVAILGQNRERSHSQLIMYSMGACKGRPCFNLNSLQCLKNKQEVKATARTIRRVKIKQNKASKQDMACWLTETLWFIYALLFKRGQLSLSIQCYRCQCIKAATPKDTLCVSLWQKRYLTEQHCVMG